MEEALLRLLEQGLSPRVRQSLEELDKLPSSHTPSSSSTSTAPPLAKARSLPSQSIQRILDSHRGYQGLQPGMNSTGSGGWS